MTKFALNFKKFENLTSKKLDKVVRKTALDMYSEIIDKSPVKTSRFRSNNLISIDKEDTRKVEIRTEAEQLNEASNKLKRNVAGSIIYIQNNLDYAVGLEYGKSKQAPQGIYGVTVLKFSKFLEDSVKESK